MKFGAFSFADIGGSAVDPARIDVNASATADTVTLSFFFANGSGAQLLGEGFFELNSAFTASSLGTRVSRGAARAGPRADP